MFNLKHLLLAAEPAAAGGAPAEGGDPPSADPNPEGGAPAEGGASEGGKAPAGGEGGQPEGKTPAEGGKAPAKGAKTPAEGGAPPAEPPPKSPPAEGEQDVFFKSLPEDWRQQTAKALAPDEASAEKYTNILNRYPTFDKFVESFFEKHDTISKGQHKQGLPENPTEEQLAEYRQANGIPEKPEDYSLDLDEGLVLSDEDERIMGPVFEVAHKHNLTPKVMSDLTNAMLQAREHEFEAEVQQHGLDSQQAIRQLKDAWGSDFETNKNVILGLFNTLPQAVRDNVMKAEMADGRMLFNSPEFMFWAADVARKLNPSATVVPNSNNPAEAINTEIQKIEQTMRDDPDAYWKDQAMQKRYEQLLEAKQSMESQQQ